MDWQEQKRRHQEQKRILDAFYQGKVLSLPLSIGISGKLTNTIFAVFTESKFDKRTAEQKLNALRKLIASRYDDLVDLFARDNRSTLKFFLGKEAETFQAIWVRLFDGCYSSGWNRRPFRTRKGIDAHFDRCILVLQAFVQLVALGITPDRFLEDPFDSLCLDNHALSAWLAYRIDSGEKELFEKVAARVSDNTGEISRTLIRALTESKDERSHKLLGGLLLAARLQEGLRQSIVESIDEGTPEAFLSLLGTILENDLQRFSSVVRGFDVWTGLPISAEKPKTVQRYLQFIRDSVSSHGQSPFDASNPIEVYLRLLCTGFREIEQALPMAEGFMDGQDPQKKAVAMFWLSQSQIPALQTLHAFRRLDEPDPLVLAFLLPNLLPRRASRISAEAVYEVPGVDIEALFQGTMSLLQRVPKKGSKHSLPGAVGVSASFSVEDVLGVLIRIADRSKKTEHLDTLCGLTEKMSPDSRTQFLTLLDAGGTSPLQRAIVVRLAGDRSMWVRDKAVEALSRLQLAKEEYGELEGMLRFKTETLRKNIVGLLLRQSPQDLLETVRRLAGSAEENCRLGAQQLVREIEPKPEFRRILAEAKRLTTATQRPSASTESSTPIDTSAAAEPTSQGFPSPAEPARTEGNAMGLFDEAALTTFAAPPIDRSYPLSKVLEDVDDLKRYLVEISRFIESRKGLEYEVVGWNGDVVKAVLGMEDYLQSYAMHDDRRAMDSYPLAGEFAALFARLFSTHELDRLLFLIEFTRRYEHSTTVSKVLDSCLHWGRLDQTASLLNGIPYLSSHILPLLVAYRFGMADEDGSAFRYRYTVASQIFDRLSESDLKTDLAPKQDEEKQVFRHYWSSKDLQHLDWLGSDPAVQFWFRACDIPAPADKDDFRRLFLLEVGMTRKFGYLSSAYLPLSHLIRAHEATLLSEVDLAFLLTRPGLKDLVQKATRFNEKSFAERRDHPSFYSVVDRVVDHIVAVEAARGEMASPLSAIVGSIGRCYGAASFARIVTAMDRRSLVRGYVFASDNSTKGESLSHLLRNLRPSAGETVVDLSRELQSTGVPLDPQKLIDAAMYSPQWLGLIEEHLSMPGLKMTGVYFHAHVNEGFDDEKIALVSHYSLIPPAEFRAGAFDPAWFKDAYSEIGETNFQKVYDSAKYIAGGNLHKRSRIFADAVRGKFEVPVMESEIRAKRNRDMVLAYSLLPLADPLEALTRYLFIEEYRKESRQFGPMRQQSEGTACDMAVDNLARSFGYDDTGRFQWQMETRDIQTLQDWFSPQSVEDVRIWISVDPTGSPALVVEKQGKVLSAVPSRLKDQPKVREGTAVLKRLRDQYKRARTSFERAMVERNGFRAEELRLLESNPVLGPLLASLVFVAGDALGFWKEGCLAGLQGSIDFDAATTLRIAHPHDFVRTESWSDWQRHIVGNRIRQPVRQVFREYYRPSRDELAEKTVSRRYAGQQIQPRKAVALAGARGWSTTDGLFRVYLRQNVVVEVFSGLVLFSPADVEAPVIETVRFYDNRTGQTLELASIDPVLFSEAMRDLDLIVSVAHVGGVDPEATHSTVEMRAALLETLIPLLKLSNVSVSGSHAQIRGAFGEYSVHLGSGVSHMAARGSIPLVPVHSSHQGRIFLPFVDDDPKTAEILSKVLLFAEDTKIKDPTLLEFIRG